MPKIGDYQYEVEWCSNLPLNKWGEGELDLAHYEFNEFKEIDKAIEFAKDLLKNNKDAFGSVRLSKQIYEETMYAPWLKEWKDYSYFHVDDLNYDYSNPEWTRLEGDY